MQNLHNSSLYVRRSGVCSQRRSRAESVFYELFFLFGSFSLSLFRRNQDVYDTIISIFIVPNVLYGADGREREFVFTSMKHKVNFVLQT